MDKVLGIIAEYNPFHNGHLYHITESKKRTNCKYTISVMSGNFTQRGSISIVNKWSKAEMALKNGIDLVIELPVLYATSSAENFAEGSIKILNALNIVDYISFGCESSSINKLINIANILATEPFNYKKNLSSNLSNGISYPKARELALKEYLNNSSIDLNIISSPNNILAIEYLKALIKSQSSILPIGIPRYMSKHNETDFNNISNIASSTSIRNNIMKNSIENIKKFVPKNSYEILSQNFNSNTYIYDLNAFEQQILYNLRKMSTSDIANIPDVSEGLEFLIKKSANKCTNLNELITCIKSKRYTRNKNSKNFTIQSAWNNKKRHEYI